MTQHSLRFVVYAVNALQKPPLANFSVIYETFVGPFLTIVSYIYIYIYVYVYIENFKTNNASTSSFDLAILPASNKSATEKDIG